MSRRATESARYVALLRAAVEAGRDLLDEVDPQGPSDAHAAALRFCDALDDVDAYCERCDDEGVVEQVRDAGRSTCDPATVDVVPCECEAARILREQRRIA